jgi:chemotaxis protein MotB
LKKARTKTPQSEQANTSGWLTTFNDMVTLLMVFFVLLFTMSSIDSHKMSTFVDSLQSGLGILNEGRKVAIGPIAPESPGLLSDSSAEDTDTDSAERAETLKRSIDETVHSLETEIGVRATVDNEGVRLALVDNVLFDFGSAEINPSGYPLLDKLADVANRSDFPIRVEGHTDNVPIRTKRFPSNWDLSVARAVNVVRYLIEEGELDPRRLSAVGYGESRPLFPNDSALKRAKNRRVNIVFMTEEY